MVPWRHEVRRVLDGCECRLSVPKQGYLNLSLANLNLNVEGGKLKSNSGFAFELGKTFFFNKKKPLVPAGLAEVRFGLDFSYLDLQYNTWDKSFDAGSSDMYYGHVGMRVGPSVTVTPLKNMHIRLYGHYAPTMSVLVLGDDLDAGGMYGYTGYLAGGLHVSYKFITVGVEMRGANTKLNKVSKDNFGADIDLPEDDTDIEDLINYDPNDVSIKMKRAEKVSTKFPGLRWTLGFRF